MLIRIGEVLMKLHHQAISFLMALILPLLFSCRKEAVTPKPADAGSTVWSETVFPLPGEYMFAAEKGGLRYSGGRIYVSTWKLTSDDAVEDVTVSWKSDGSDFREETGEDGLEPCREGAFIQSQVRLANGETATMEVTPGTSGTTGWFCVRDEMGSTLFSVDLPGCFGQNLGEGNAAAGEGFQFRNAAVVGKGGSRRYLAATNAGLVCLDSSGKVLSKLSPCDVCAVTVVGETVYYFQQRDANAGYTGGTRRSYSLYAFDVKTGERGEEIALPPTLAASSGKLFGGWEGGYSACWSNGQGLYGLSLFRDEKGANVCTGTLLIDWNESDLTGNYEDLCVLDGDTVCAVTMSFDDSTPQLFVTSLSLLHRLPPEVLENRIRLEVASLSLFDLENLRAKAIEFNKSHPGCHITVTDKLAEYEGDFDAARLHLDAEIADGAVPDVLYISHANSKLTTAQDYVRAGVFTDLVPLMEASTFFDREDLVGCVTKPFTDEKGRQFLLPTTLNSGVLVSNGALAGPMSPDKMMAYYETLPDDVSLIINDPASLRRFLLYAGIDDFMDETAGTCSFNDGRFAAIERFCREKLETVHKEDAFTNESDRWSLLRDGKLILLDTTFDSLLSYGRLQFQGGGTLIPVGYPNEQGVVYGSHYLNGYLGITEACEHKTEALEYLWEFFAPPGDAHVDLFSHRVDNASSLTRTGIRAQAAALADYTIVNADDDRLWSLVPDEEADSYKGAQLKITEEDAEQFIAFLDSIEKNITTAGPLWDIINDELRSDVPNSPEKLADNIQSRAALYLAEHAPNP